MDGNEVIKVKDNYFLEMDFIKMSCFDVYYCSMYFAHCPNNTDKYISFEIENEIVSNDYFAIINWIFVIAVIISFLLNIPLVKIILKFRRKKIEIEQFIEVELPSDLYKISNYYWGETIYSEEHLYEEIRQ